jgi:hypothetical protein
MSNVSILLRFLLLYVAQVLIKYRDAPGRTNEGNPRKQCACPSSGRRTGKGNNRDAVGKVRPGSGA